MSGNMRRRLPINTYIDQTIVLDVQAVVTKNMLNEDILLFLNTATSSRP